MLFRLILNRFLVTRDPKPSTKFIFLELYTTNLKSYGFLTLPVLKCSLIDSTTQNFVSITIKRCELGNTGR